LYLARFFVYGLSLRRSGILLLGKYLNPWRNLDARIRNGLIVRMLLDLGIRRGELLGIEIRDVDFRKNELTIHRTPDTFPISRIEASIFQLRGYSAHADQNGLLNWLCRSYKDGFSAAGRVVFIQHGGNTQRSYLVNAVRKKAEETGKRLKCFNHLIPELSLI